MRPSSIQKISAPGPSRTLPRAAAMALAVPLLLTLGCGGTSASARPVVLPSGGANALDARYAEREPLEVLHGRASYYSDRLAGHRTANGDRYRPRLFTAASRDLPFGTIVRVVREDDGRAVTVRVNDRGPFGDHSRILDLSRAAAEQLGMIRAGVVRIRAEILERGAGRRHR